MQISSFVHAAVVVVSLASVGGVATLAYADAPKSTSQQTMSQPRGTDNAVPSPTTVANTGAYDSPDFVVPESNIYP